MHARKNTEEISVQRRRIRHARISEHRRKKRRKRDPQDHQRREPRRKRAVKFFDEGAYDERRILRLLPRQNTQNTRLHDEVEDSNSRNRDENAARNIFLRLANLTAEMADVVVTPVGVYRVDRGRTKPGKEKPRKIPGPWSVSENQPRIEMRGPTPDEPEDRADDADPKQHRDFPDRSDPPVEQRDENDHQRAGNRFLAVLAERMEVGRILRKTDCARSQAERRLNQRLPDEQKRHQAAETARSVGFAEKDVAATGKRHCRA